MAQFTPQKLILSNINNGNEFENGDGIYNDAVNAPIEAVAYIQAMATTQPDNSQANNVGTASVEIIEVNGLPQLKFKNLKGIQGEQGIQGEPGPGTDVRINNTSIVSNNIANFEVDNQVANNNKLVYNSAVYTGLSAKVDDMTKGLYNSTAGNPKPIKFLTINYSDCDSNNGVFIKISMVSGHGNGTSYTFLQDAFFNVGYTGTVSVELFKYFGQSIQYDNIDRQYGDIFYVIDTTNKIVDFYTLMGQYSYMYMSPYKKLNSSSKGVITQQSTASVYSTGTQNWATGGDIATKSYVDSLVGNINTALTTLISGSGV